MQLKVSFAAHTGSHCQMWGWVHVCHVAAEFIVATADVAHIKLLKALDLSEQFLVLYLQMVACDMQCADGVSLAGIEVPAAAVRTNADGDVIDLDIDLSVLEAIPDRVIKAKKLLGPQYSFVPRSTANIGFKKLLSFAEYTRQLRSL